MSTKKERSNHDDKPPRREKQNTAGDAKGSTRPRANAKEAREKHEKSPGKSG